MGREPIDAGTRAKLPVPGDYAKSAQLMNPADKSLFLHQKQDQFILKVRQIMPPKEIEKLPADTSEYFNTIISKALDRVDHFHADLADLVVAQWYLSPHKERFIYDAVNKGMLFTDSNGELVTLKGAKINTIDKGLPNEDTQNISSYEKAYVWTGPEAEKEFTPQEKGIPLPTLPKQELFTGRPERTKLNPRQAIYLFVERMHNTPLNRITFLPEDLTAESMREVSPMVKKALDNIDLYGPDLAHVLEFVYHYSPKFERFFRDPSTGGILYADPEHNLVVLNNATLQTGEDGLIFINNYQDCTVLSGLDKGKTFTKEQKPLPKMPKPSRYAVIPSLTLK